MNRHPELVLSLVGLMASCDPLMERGPTVDGVVFAVGQARDFRLWIENKASVFAVWITEGDPAKECGVVFLVEASTDLVRRTRDGKLGPARREPIAVGEPVRAGHANTFFKGRCPAGIEAEAIELIRPRPVP